MNDKQPSVFGGACIIASVCVGAGMLGLPSAGAGAWTLWTCLAMLVTMMVMTLSGWMLLEAYKRYDIRVSFDTVTHDMFGSGANTINNIAVYFVGGILLYAYITTAGMILPPLIGLNSKLSSILFVIVFGAFVWHSTGAVDRISVVLIVFMALSFIFSIFGLTKNISFNTLFNLQETHSTYIPHSLSLFFAGLAKSMDISTIFTTQNPPPSYAPYVLAMFPVALASFGYHHSAASMRAYYGEERKASRAILGGTLITLVFYIVWIASIFGNLPREQFAPVIKAGGDLDVLLPALSSVIHSENVNHAIRAFSMAAILSSFIGVGLGVFDFLADFFKFSNDNVGRTKSWLATFLPPLVLSLAFPTGFLIAIGYAGAVATIWTCIMPALLVRESRRRGYEGFTVPGGMFMVWFVFCFGIAVAVLHILNMMGKLPVYTG
ncbi:aromatic amino acid transport family protein [uncultured Cardiobacterium sp.]|uniref:aromatic amino acid transport family protein n=1 Tax=uncultured Cardiobacterium sp. TaxID=417619 RepID=UPI00261B0257|nr:aromatic amino acid transport family protein [uncultured Cardiobacterium sp.]